MDRQQVLEILLRTLVFMLGAGIGSFLNVVIYRLPLGISVNNPRRSFCPSCRKQIPWYRNIPLVSWLALRGKCAECGSKISFRYFFVELLTGFLFYVVFLKFSGNYGPRVFEHIAGWGPLVLIFWIFTALLVSGTFIDIDHQILPHVITLGGLCVGLLGSYWQPEMMNHFLPGMDRGHAIVVSFVSAAVALGLLWTVVELGKLAFGRIKESFEQPKSWTISQPDENEPPLFQMGDTKLSWADIFTRASDRLILQCTALDVNEKTFQKCRAEIRQHEMKVFVENKMETIPLDGVKKLEGQATEIVIPREAMGFGDVLLLAMIGSFLGWQAVLFTIVAGSVLGTVCAVVPRLIGRAEWGARIPFGPYLAAGAMIWLFYGQQFLDWYLSRLQFRG
jgi:leader peptidase (prepilin peptidase)/N-methyltransferase